MECYIDRPKLRGMIVRSFVALGVFLFVATSASHRLRLLGWVGAVMTSIGLVVFVRRLANREPQIVIDDVGFTDRRQAFRTIPWSAIKSVRVEWRSAEFLGIELARPEEYLDRLPGRVRWAA